MSYRDLDNGINVLFWQIPAYIAGDAQSNMCVPCDGTTHANVNWGISQARITDVGINAANPYGCTWVRFVHWRMSGANANTVTFALGTNPYNL